MPRQPTKREQNKAETKARLMDAARKEFARKGFAGTSLRTITSRAGVTTGAFYTHFRGKREIYLALLEELARTLRTIMEDAVGQFLEARRQRPKHDPTMELLRVPISRVLGEATRNRDLFEILRRDGLARDRDPEFGRYYRRIFREFTDPMQQGLEGLIEAGLSRPYNTERLAQAAAILFFSMAIFASKDGMSDMEGWVETLAAMIHGGAKQLSSRGHAARGAAREPEGGVDSILDTGSTIREHPNA